MSRYETDEEQWEAIKRWWQENGKSIMLAAVLGIGAVAGWNWWQQHQYQKAVLASSTFELLQLKYQQGQFKDVAREAHKLETEQPDSPYASGAAFLMASWLATEKKDLEGALTQLDWVVEHAPEAAMKDVAQLRAARLLADAKAFEQAQARLSRVVPAGLPPAAKGLYDYVTGEVALFHGELAKARQAFKAVVENKSADPGLQQLAQLQLDDLTPIER